MFIGDEEGTNLEFVFTILSVLSFTVKKEYGKASLFFWKFMAE
jgi:hypothetical protein